jgi:hypothetical protein
MSLNLVGFGFYYRGTLILEECTMDEKRNGRK